MDGERFDALARAAAGARSRRGILKGLGAAALGVAGLSRFGGADAAGICRHADVVCLRNADCCSDQCGPKDRTGRRRCVCDQIGQTSCNGTCVDTQTDVNNCGACGNACPASDACGSWSCASGTCVMSPVSAGTTCGPAANSCTAASSCDGAGTCNLGLACPSESSPGGGCYWLDCFDYNGCCWVSFPDYGDQASCVAQDSCNGGGGQSGGGCYKWDTQSC